MKSQFSHYDASVIISLEFNSLEMKSDDLLRAFWFKRKILDVFLVIFYEGVATGRLKIDEWRQEHCPTPIAAAR